MSAVLSESMATRMQAIAAGVRTSAEQAVKLYCKALVTNLIIESTPFLSGQARSNWQVTIGTPTDIFIPFIPLPEAVRARSYDAGAVADAQQVADEAIQQFQAGQTVYIQNNAPYIVRLNNGYSRQAPAGFVEAAIAATKAGLQDFGVVG